MPGRVTELSETQIVADLFKDRRRQAAATTSVQMPQPAKDTFTVAATPATTYQLTAIPYQGTGGSSLNFSLNGVELIEGVDYTVDYTTAIVTVSATLKGTPTPADVLTADYWTTGDLIALSASPDVGGPTLRGQGGATGTGVTSITITLDNAVHAGDTVVVVGFLNLGPGDPTTTGLGATWLTLSASLVRVMIGTGVTAGTNTITVTAAGAGNFTFVAAALSNLGAYSGTSVDTATGPTIDMPGQLNTVPANPTAGQTVVAAWSLINSVVASATTGFTDSNGTYTQITSQAGNSWLAELGFASIPASGVTHHSATRSDSANGTGFALVFNAA